MRVRYSRLPKEYSEVEYLQSTGTQYIVLPTNLSCDYFELDCQYTATNAEMCVIGNSDGGSTNRWELFCVTDRPTYNLWTAYNSQGTTTSTVNASVRATLCYSYTNSTLAVRPITGASSIISKTLNSQPYTLFQYGNNYYMAKAKIFGYLCKKNGELKMKLVPCIRNSDSKPGFYDTVRNVFMTNGASSGSDFSYGNKTTCSAQFRLDVSLPSIYQQVEYIQGTGTQYINTDFIPDNTSGVMIKASSSDTNDTVMVGVRTSGNRWWIGSNGNLIYAGWNTNDDASARATFTTNTPYIYQLNYMNNRKRICDGVEKTAIGSTVLATQTYPACILSGNAEGTTTSLIKKGRIYYVIFTRGDKIMNHYIPCYRKSDNVIGLYDLVTGAFLTNAGSGTFGKGSNVVSYSGGKSVIPKIPYTYQEVDYISNANGNQYFEVPFVPNGATGFKVEIGFNPTATGKRYCLLSNYNTGSQQLSLEINTANKVRFWINSGAKDVTTSNTFTVNAFNSIVYEFKNNTYSMNLNGTTTSGSYTWTGASTSSTMRAFLDLAGRTSTFPTPLKIYYIRIYEGDKLTFELIPCYRKSDTAIGMYDTKKLNFKTNAGSGAFTKGTNKNTII